MLKNFLHQTRPLLFRRTVVQTKLQSSILNPSSMPPMEKFETEMPNSDSDWDFPLTDEDLRTIDSLISRAPPLKRHRLNCHNDDEDDGASIDFMPKPRRRLPSSLFVFQQQQRNDNVSTGRFSPGYSRSYCGRNPSQFSPLQEVNFGGRIIYSRTREEVERAAQELLDFAEATKRNEGQCILGLDIEWRPTFRRGVSPGKAAVMQICSDSSRCHVLHIIHSGIPKELRSLLEDNNSLKVGVCIANDARKILKDYEVSINNLQDISNKANQKLGGNKTWSLSSLAETLICKQVYASYFVRGTNSEQLIRSEDNKLAKPNIIRLGNWEVDALSSKQLKYAATDAYVSWYLYQVLDNYPDPAANEATETGVKLS